MTDASEMQDVDGDANAIEVSEGDDIIDNTPAQEQPAAIEHPAATVVSDDIKEDIKDDDETHDFGAYDDDGCCCIII